ncbi:MAG: glycine zipper 2TM domain-containing protein [Desulfobulbaceae bacterium]|nr:glycine zipper 2TM domain-containing protein [Desulfobulbaceae bacterium]
MKKNIVLLVLTLLVFSVGTVQAGNNARQSTTAGAVGGALVGQAISRNTEGTLIGATLGGVIGYIVGNEMDKNGEVRYVHHSRPEVKYVYVTPPRRPPVKVIIQNAFDYDYRNGTKHWRKPRPRGYNKHRHHKKYRSERRYRESRDNYRIVIR